MLDFSIVSIISCTNLAWKMANLMQGYNDFFSIFQNNPIKKGA